MNRRIFNLLTFIIVFSIFSSIVLIVPKYFPLSGLFVFFTLLTVLVFIKKSSIGSYERILACLLFLLSASLILRTNLFLIFLDLVGISYLGSALVLSKGTASFRNLLDAFLAPLTMFFSVLSSENLFRVALGKGNKDRNTTKRLLSILISIGISGLVLMLVLPLLASSNPFFNQILKNIINFFRLSPITVGRIVFSLFLMFFLTKLLSMVSVGGGLKHSVDIDISPYIFLTKILLSAILVVFFITQFQLYTASDKTLAGLGYSNSRQTNEVFFQLLVVSFIVLMVIYNDTKRSKQSIYLSVFLIFEILFLTLIAFKADAEYISAWGLTHKRLYGLVVIVWFLGILPLFMNQIVKQLHTSVFVNRAVLYTGILLVLVNLANFEKMIYGYNPSTNVDKIDHLYLSRLRPESGSHLHHINSLSLELLKGSTDFKLINAMWRELALVDYLNEKYKKVDLRTFNFSEYSEYLKLKDLDVNALKSKLSSNQNGTFIN